MLKIQKILLKILVLKILDTKKLNKHEKKYSPYGLNIFIPSFTGVQLKQKVDYGSIEKQIGFR